MDRGLDLEPLLPSSFEDSARRLNQNNRHLYTNKPLLRRRSSESGVASMRRYRCLMLCLIGVIILMGVGVIYNCPEFYCFARKPLYNLAPPPAPLQIDINFVTYDTIQRDNFEFNINGSDVMVFLHIQKTGGSTFGKHLVQDIDLESPCLCKRKPKNRHKKKLRPKRDVYEYDELPFDEIEDRPKRKLKCDCFRPNGKASVWLFSRYSTGWKCGLHPDWTELTECVNDYLNRIEGEASRRYFYITFLRNPVQRYLSEFKHVQRGATWKGSEHKCNGVSATREHLPKCYDDLVEEDWSGVSLQEFMKCPHNLAVNRQTRMLADLKLVNCYDTSTMSSKARDMIMLNSAKTNLEKMAYFGLTEKQHDSQILFQHTFDLQFKKPFRQNNDTLSNNIVGDLDPSIVDQIKELNHLDIELYEFAKTLLEKRCSEAEVCRTTHD